MKLEKIRLAFTTDSIEGSRELLSICRDKSINHEDLIPRPPSRKGYQLDLPSFEYIIELASQLPWDLVLPYLVDYIIEIIKNALKRPDRPGEITVSIEGSEPIVCRSEDDIERVEQAIRDRLNSIKDESE